MGVAFGWWGWLSAAVSVGAGVVLLYLLASWLSDPIRYRGRTFADFPGFLGSWAVSLDGGGRISIEREPSGKPRIRFRVSGRGSGKTLRARFPTRQQTLGGQAAVPAVANQHLWTRRLAGAANGRAGRSPPRGTLWVSFALPSRARVGLRLGRSRVSRWLLLPSRCALAVEPSTSTRHRRARIVTSISSSR